MSAKKEDLINEFLKPGNMLRLYATGAFPMADEKTGAIEWYLPETRCIIPLDKFNIPRSAKKKIDKLNFEIRFDTETVSVTVRVVPDWSGLRICEDFGATVLEDVTWKVLKAANVDPLKPGSIA